MTSQVIRIGIVVGIFFAGLGIGYAVFSMAPSTVMMGSGSRYQMMNQMISDPQTMTEFMNQIMENPQAMRNMHESMIKSPEHMKLMHQMMMNNTQHMQQMTNTMKNMTKMGHRMGQWLLIISSDFFLIVINPIISPSNHEVAL